VCGILEIKLPPVNSVDNNISGEVAIAKVWRDHYESILNRPIQLPLLPPFG